MEKKNKLIFAIALSGLLFSSVFGLAEQRQAFFGWHDTYKIDQVNHCFDVSPCFITPQVSLAGQTVLIDPRQVVIGSPAGLVIFQIFLVAKLINNKSPPGFLV